MRRSLSICVWILVGALTAGLSVGYFLHAANRDRETLAAQAQAAERRAEEASAINARLVEEANTKLKDASAEIQRTKDELQAHRLYQQQLAQATPLEKPLTRNLRNWTQTFSLSLGLSFLLPPGSFATDTADRFTVLRNGTNREERWMTVIPYHSEQEEQDWINGLTNTSPLLYSLGTHLLTGMEGTRPNSTSTVYVLRLQPGARSSHLFWIESLPGIDKQRILQTLATLSVNP